MDRQISDPPAGDKCPEENSQQGSEIDVWLGRGGRGASVKCIDGVGCRGGLLLWGTL